MSEQQNLFMEMDPETEELIHGTSFDNFNLIPMSGKHLSIEELKTYKPKYIHLADGTLYELKGTIPRAKVVHDKPAAPEAPAETAPAAAPAAGGAAAAPAAPAAPPKPVAAPKTPPGEGLKKVLSLIDMPDSDEFVKLIYANREHPEDFDIRAKMQKQAQDFYLKVAMAFKDNRKPELRALLRFRAMLDESFLTPEEISTVTKLTAHKEDSENIFYFDEWLEALFDGVVGMSFDEVKRTEIFRKTKKPVRTIKEYDAGMIELLGEEAAWKFELENVTLQWPFLCIGRRGNHFPFLESGMVPGDIAQTMARKNQVLRQMEIMEKLDHKLFMREVLGKLPNGQEGFIDLHQQPYVVLANCVASNTVCWDGWHRCDKRNSRGRVAMPVFPEKGLDEAVTLAMGDYRWTLAKDSAMDWANEGLTGNYFKYWTEEKKKPAEESAINKGIGLKENFIEDYMTWLKWESKGIQKINKELRPLFWRYAAFNPEKRAELAKVAPIYAELAAKSATWERQDAAEKKKKK